MFSDISSPIRYCKVNFSALSQIFIFIFNPEFPPEPRWADPSVLTALCFTEAFINGVMPWKIKGFLLSWSAKSSYTSLWFFVLECGHHFWKTNIHSYLQVRKKIKACCKNLTVSQGSHLGRQLWRVNIKMPSLHILHSIAVLSLEAALAK